MAAKKSSDGALLRSAVATLTRRLRAQDGPAAVGPAGLGILGLLMKEGAASASELAALAQVQPQSLTRALAALEKDKLIARRVDADDRRRAVLWITPKGEDELRATMRKRIGWLARAMDEHLNDDERETLRAASMLMERLAGSETNAPPTPADQVFNLIPFTHVRNVEASVVFYGRLGFVVDGKWEAEGELVYASMHARTVRAARIMFSKACEPIVPAAQQIHFYCWTDDLAALHQRLIAEGLAPSAISNPDNMKEGEFNLRDPDGYLITVGQPKRRS
jgi:DNA-binding MarR family transcriptional regulator